MTKRQTKETSLVHMEGDPFFAWARRATFEELREIWIEFCYQRSAPWKLGRDFELARDQHPDRRWVFLVVGWAMCRFAARASLNAREPSLIEVALANGRFEELLLQTMPRVLH